MWTGGQTRTIANGSSCPDDWLQPGPQCGPFLSPEAPLLGDELPCQAPQAQRAEQPRTEEPQIWLQGRGDANNDPQTPGG